MAANDELATLLREKLTITGDGNVVGKDNTVNVVKQKAGDYAIQIGQVNVNLSLDELHRLLEQVRLPHPFFREPPRPVDDEKLATAREKLAALPLDAIPDPAPLPPGSRMPLSRNPLFVGREDDLKALAMALRAGKMAAIGQVEIAAATGLGGIGKTQLASEFVHCYGQFFAGGVFWLGFADPDAIPAEVASCGGSSYLNLRPDFVELPIDHQVRLVLAAWQSPLPRLLVFDNCEDPDLLARWRPPTGGARVLVTSRRAEWEAALGVRALPLGVLNRAESVALLCKHRPDLTGDTPHLDAIAEELGDLPLALHLAGNYLAHYRHIVTPSTYLSQLRQPDLLQHRSLQGADFMPTGHGGHVARTFALSYEKLDATNATDQLALALLARAASFAPGEPIPRQLLRAALHLAEDDFEVLIQAEDALVRLEALGLLESEAEGSLHLHRLLAAFVQNVAVDAESQAAVEQVMLETARRANTKGYPAPLLALQPHLRAVINAVKGRGDETEAALNHEFAHHLGDVGHYSAAQPYYERALAIREQTLGKSHPDTASTLDALGWLFSKKGDHKAARGYYERALAIREQALGENHPDTASTLNNLGNLLWSQGKNIEAQSYCERALKIRVMVFGKEDPNVASSLNSLGNVHWAKKEHAKARDYYERALETRKITLGEIHPKVALSLRNLGALLYDQRDYEAARPYFEKALDVYKRASLEEHPDAVLVLNNLGALYHAQGDLKAAQPYYQQALTIAKDVLGSTHPRTQMVQKNLEMLRRQANQPG